MLRKFLWLLLLLPFAPGVRAQTKTWTWIQDSPVIFCGQLGSISSCTIGASQIAPTTAGSVWVLDVSTPNNVTITSITGGGGTWIKCPNCHIFNPNGYSVDAWYNLTGNAGTTQNITINLSGTSGAFFNIDFIEVLPPAGFTASYDDSGSVIGTNCTSCTGVTLNPTATDMIIYNPGGKAAQADWKAYSSPYVTDVNGGAFSSNTTSGVAPTMNLAVANNPSMLAIAFKSTAGIFPQPSYQNQNSIVQFISGTQTCSPTCTLALPQPTGAGHLLFVMTANLNNDHIIAVTGAGTPWVIPAGANTCQINYVQTGNDAFSCGYILSTSAGASSINMTLNGNSSTGFGIWEIASTTGTFVLDAQGSHVNGPPNTPTPPGQALTITGSNDVIFQGMFAPGGASSGGSFYPQTYILHQGAGYILFNEASEAVLLNSGPTAPTPIWVNPQFNTDPRTAAIGIAFTTVARTITATDCNSAAVNTAIASANTGDTVLVPAGACTWAGVTLNKAITVQGAGVGQTNITLTGNNNVTKSAAGVQRIVGFSFSISGGGNANKGFTASGSWRNAQPVVFQNNAFTTNGSALFLVTVPGGFIWANNTFSGQWDDSFLQIKDAQDPQGSWAFTDSIGTHDTNGTLNHYVETNTFTGGTNQGIDCDDGCRAVYRNNTLVYSDFNSHGEDTSAVGIRHFEIYNNNFTAPQPAPTCGGANACLGNENQEVWIRGGTGVIYNNHFDAIAGSFWGTKSNVRMNNRGIEDVRPQGTCGSVSYPAPHQLGQNNNGANTVDPAYGSRGAGDFTDPIYFWNNTGTLLTAFGFNWGNPCGFTFSTFFQTGRDVVNPAMSGGSPKPGYTAFTYPHPLVQAVTGPALNVYLAQTAAGAANGSSCTDPLAASYFNASGNWGTGLTQIGGGTTVHLCGVITSSLAAPASQGTGTITIIFEPGASMQQPAATNFIAINNRTNSYIITGQAPCGSQNHVFVACTESVKNTANGSPSGFANTVTGVKALNFSGTTGPVTVQNLELGPFYVHNDPTDIAFSDGAHLANAVWADQMMGNITIQSNDMHDASFSISINPRQSSPNPVLTVANNDLHNNDHDFVMQAVCSPSCYSVVLHDNHSHDHTNWNTGASNTYHHDGFHFFGSFDQASRVDMYNNLFDGPWTLNNTGPIFNQSAVQNLTAFNNVFICNVANCTNDPVAMWQYGGGPNQFLANNTIIQTGVPRGSGPAFLNNGGALITNPNGNSVNVSFLNNLVDSAANFLDFNSQVLAANSATSGIDYNLYSNPTTSGNRNFAWNGTRTDSFATWQTLSGEGTHSQLVGNGLLAADGTPQSGSPAIGIGSNLTSLCVGNLLALCSDFYGNPRPTAGPWNVGAIGNPGAGTPLAALSQTSAAFFNQMAGTTTSLPMFVTLSNNGTASLNIASFTFSGTNPADFAQTSNCGAGIAAGTSCVISITFSPSALGPRSATLNINDNASGSPQTVALSGNGFKTIAGGLTISGQVTVKVQ